ncbi:MAG: type II secretion system F family protein [Acidobacteriota bacterium]
MGLDQAILQVSKELEHAHPEISEEFGFVNLELKAGKRRVEALRNLAERTGVDDLKKLVAVLIQADRFGTGVAQSLRAHADFMRIQARQVAEEKAAKLGREIDLPDLLLHFAFAVCRHRGSRRDEDCPRANSMMNGM